MQRVEARPGLRRFLPFLREKRQASDSAKEEIIDGQLRIPADIYNPEGLARISVLTHRTGENWKTTVAVYDPERESTEPPRIIGRTSFTASSKDEALKKELKFLDENAEVVGYNDIELKEPKGLKRVDISDRYSQRVYRVGRKR